MPIVLRPRALAAFLVLSLGFWNAQATRAQELADAESASQVSENAVQANQPGDEGEASAGAAEETAVDVTELPAQLASWEAVEMTIAAEPEQQFHLISKISPRGLDEATRVKMVAGLLPLLESTYPDIRARTATAISLFGKSGEQAIPALVKRLGDSEIDYRRRTVSATASAALARLGTVAIEPVMERIAEAEGIEFLGIVGVISDLGETDAARATAPFFLKHLKEGPPNHRWACMYCLSKLGDVAKPAMVDYIEHLDDRNFNMQVMACRALAELGPLAKPAVPRLVKLTGKKGNMLSTRTHAAMALGAIGVDGDVELLPVFQAMIAEPNAFCQERGLIAIGRLGAVGKEAADAILALLAKQDFSQRPEAALALWQISGEAERSLNLMGPMITDLTYDFRTLTALQAMGEAAAPLEDLVAKRLDVDDASLQLMVAEVLSSMGKLGGHADRLRELADLAPPDIAVEMDALLAGLEGVSQGVVDDVRSP